MPDADDVLAAIRRLDLSGPHETDDLGPSVEAGVSGRTASAGGPLVVSPPLRDLGLLLDDALIDNLLMSEGPQVSIPVEMALDALSAHEARAGARVSDTLGARRRLTSWSGLAGRRERLELTATLVPSPPAFLTEWPIRPRASRAPSRFPWDLLGSDRRPPLLDRSHEDAAVQDLPAAEAGSFAPNGAAPAPQRAAAGGISSGIAAPHHAARAEAAEDTAGIERERDRREREAGLAIAEARRSPSPAAVALASLVFPGWGQALNEERRKAAAYRLAYLATLFFAATLAWRGPIGRLAASLASVDTAPAFAWIGTAFTAGAGVWLLSIYDALVVRIARRRTI